MSLWVSLWFVALTLALIILSSSMLGHSSQITVISTSKRTVSILTLSPMAYRILWLLWGGGLRGPPLKVIEGVLFERGHENRK